ncbi:hypothetical protein PR003_g4534 [Phytophthora rubi]|uniref:Uncharacterized protein n=1 Tax=Phytophthora rubi TaxID=129364 RepID=A0A6A3KNS3_9STRA|nr:hypothetical protein PR002_g16383 [Phytophthora rubi]KAE9007792.1 hypothetical protein PR001_g16877 [Phytophthora rubi]KAE9352121.1 hypothetical protein PR003_g4534 [Phytophthora rubi]
MKSSSRASTQKTANWNGPGIAYLLLWTVSGSAQIVTAGTTFAALESLQMGLETVNLKLNNKIFLVCSRQALA